MPLVSSFLAMFSWGASDVVSTKVYRLIGSFKGVLFSQLIGVPLLLLLLPFQNFNQPFNFLPVILLGAADTGVWWLFAYAARVGNIAIVGPLFQTSFVTTVTLGLLFLGESLTINKLLGGAFVLIGAILLSLKINALHRKKLTDHLHTGVLPALLAAVGAGTYLFFLAPLSRVNGWIATTIVVRLAIGTTMFLASSLRRINPFTNWQAVPWSIVITMSFLDQLALITYNFAVTRLDVSLVSIIVSASTLVTVILAATFLKEKLTTLQKLGALAVFTGLISLGL